MELIVKFLWFLLGSYSLIIFYFFFGWRKLKQIEMVEKLPSITVLIPARNEEERLGPCLESLIAQDYPKNLIEIIVIDDHSEDNTAQFARSFGVKVIEMRDINANSYKKLAVEKGVKEAKGEFILTTDADCFVPKTWAKEMASHFQVNNAKFIAGPVAYHNDNSIFEKLQHLEFLALIGVGGGGIANNFPMFCNGANMGFHKESFLQLDGFKGIDNIASGDDELLLHRFNRKFPNQINFVKSRGSLILTDAVPTLSQFVHQRRRWASKTRQYKNNYITTISVITYLLNLLIVSLGIGSIFLGELVMPFFMGLGIKTVIEFPLIFELTSFAKRRGLLWLFPFEQLLYGIYIVLMAPAALIGKYQWKGRRVK